MVDLMEKQFRKQGIRIEPVLNTFSFGLISAKKHMVEVEVYSNVAY